jgi:hypothetical protein
MSHDPHPLIIAKEAEIEKRRRELELMEAELRGMRAILRAPTSAGADPVVRTMQSAHVSPFATIATELRRGRQPGAISHQWRDTLRMLFMSYPDGFTAHNAVVAARGNGLSNVKPQDAAERLTSYMGHNYVERLPDGNWRVTDFAVQKYGFHLPKMNEAPAEEPEGAS